MEHRARLLAAGLTVLALSVTSWLPTPAAAIEGKLGFSLLRMEPSGQDAKEFSDPGWGGGLHVVLPMPAASNLLAGVIGVEFVNLLGETTTLYDSQTLLRVEQQTDQYYGRLYLGPEFGPHGNGTFRPHVGANVALVFYGISTDVVVPDDYNREQEIRQNLRDENRAAFGYDVNLGVDINPWNNVSIDVGARFLKSFNVPQQLGAGSVTISPGYVQGYLGVGISMGWLGRQSSGP
jgi:opacity protein-like surface antigen